MDNSNDIKHCAFVTPIYIHELQMYTTTHMMDNLLAS